MTDLQQTYGDVTVALPDEGYVATVTIHRPPDNFFDIELIASIASAYEQLDADPRCRAIVLGSEGKHFCAGAAFHRRSSDTPMRTVGLVQRCFDLMCERAVSRTTQDEMLGKKQLVQGM